MRRVRAHTGELFKLVAHDAHARRHALVAVLQVPHRHERLARHALHEPMDSRCTGPGAGQIGVQNGNFRATISVTPYTRPARLRRALRVSA